GMAETRTWQRGDKSYSNALAATAPPVSASTRAKWRPRRPAATVRRIAMSGATTEGRSNDRYRRRRAESQRRDEAKGIRTRAGAPACRVRQAPAVGGAQGPEGLHPLRGTRRRRQGRHDQGDDRAGE